MAVKKPWADGPFELIPTPSSLGDKPKGSQAIVPEMLIVHNFLLRGINSIYLQCVNVERSPAVIPDFVNFAACWGSLLHEHHEAEETMMFPSMEKLAGVTGLMDANVDQHRAFHGGLEAYEGYLSSVKEGKEKYDGQKLRGLIDSFMPVLRQHLHDEIDTLVKLSQYEDKADWDKWFKDLQAEILKKANDPKVKVEEFPYALQTHDTTFEGGKYAAWPPMPWFVLILFRWVFVPKHKGWWQFAPCDTHGRPRDLPFAE
ncbi:Hemerythrin HHE cation binding domain-containing protein [Pleurostoma richardsiae]|uniref:Hemerythrin HHE cation binding domain-containing protein n=1 Tax=Pleurostoma richardsiae TaxID=41990 RepID=A0AA38S430_9PEZI|nr:Hemerythrin HHE cation binding domain-containing protein [Pleurostoma richardsiae]